MYGYGERREMYSYTRTPRGAWASSYPIPFWQLESRVIKSYTTKDSSNDNGSDSFVSTLTRISSLHLLTAPILQSEHRHVPIGPIISQLNPLYLLTLRLITLSPFPYKTVKGCIRESKLAPKPPTLERSSNSPHSLNWKIHISDSLYSNLVCRAPKGRIAVRKKMRKCQALSIPIPLSNRAAQVWPIYF